MFGLLTLLRCARAQKALTLKIQEQEFRTKCASLNDVSY